MSDIAYTTAGNVLVVTYGGAIDQPTFWEHLDAIKELPFVEHVDADFVADDMWVYVNAPRWTGDQIAAIVAIVEGEVAL